MEKPSEEITRLKRNLRIYEVMFMVDVIGVFVFGALALKADEPHYAGTVMLSVVAVYNYSMAKACSSKLAALSKKADKND